MLPSENVLHVVPVNDTHEHCSDDPYCLCEPVTEPVRAEDGSGEVVGYMVIHNSWDGREQWENAPVV